jgi:hypothetical protein
MKKISLYIILFFLYFFLSDCSKETYIPSCYIAHIPDAYDYPLKPGMPGWELLNSSAEMDSVLQIPEDVLFSISTEGLIETVLSYPRFADLYFQEDIQFAFDILIEHFNGFPELLKRQDAAILLLNRYKSMEPRCQENNWPSIPRPGSSTSFSFAFIEILLAQYDILQQLDNEDTHILLKEAIEKYEEKQVYNYSVFSKKHTVLIAGRILFLNNYAPFMEEYSNDIYVKNFIDRIMLYSNFDTLDRVYVFAIDYILKSLKKEK